MDDNRTTGRRGTATLTGEGLMPFLKLLLTGYANCDCPQVDIGDARLWLPEDDLRAPLGTGSTETSKRGGAKAVTPAYVAVRQDAKSAWVYDGSSGAGNGHGELDALHRATQCGAIGVNFTIGCPGKPFCVKCACIIGLLYKLVTPAPDSTKCRDTMTAGGAYKVPSSIRGLVSLWTNITFPDQVWEAFEAMPKNEMDQYFTQIEAEKKAEKKKAK